jgi:TPR repeat protein
MSEMKQNSKINRNLSIDLSAIPTSLKTKSEEKSKPQHSSLATSQLVSFTESKSRAAAEKAFANGYKYFQLKRYNRALPELIKAADKNYPPAFLCLSYIYDQTSPSMTTSSSTVIVETTATQYLQQATLNLHFFQAQASKTGLGKYFLGFYYEQLHNGINPQARTLYREAANYGIAEAQYKLFLDPTISSSEQQAWLEKSAKHDYALAQFELAENNLLGKYGKKDVSAGMDYLLSAAKQGLYDAQIELADIYNMREQKKAAMFWYEQAIAQNRNGKFASSSFAAFLSDNPRLIDPKRFFALCEAEGNLEIFNQVRSRAITLNDDDLWFRLPADKGDANAQYVTAMGYKKEQKLTSGPQKTPWSGCSLENVKLAKFYMEKSANQGLYAAQLEMVSLCEELHELDTMFYWFEKVVTQETSLESPLVKNFITKCQQYSMKYTYDMTKRFYKLCNSEISQNIYWDIYEKCILKTGEDDPWYFAAVLMNAENRDALAKRYERMDEVFSLQQQGITIAFFENQNKRWNRARDLLQTCMLFESENAAANLQVFDSVHLTRTAIPNYRSFDQEVLLQNGEMQCLIENNNSLVSHDDKPLPAVILFLIAEYLYPLTNKEVINVVYPLFFEIQTRPSLKGELQLFYESTYLPNTELSEFIQICESDDQEQIQHAAQIYMAKLPEKSPIKLIIGKHLGVEGPSHAVPSSITTSRSK